MLKVVGAGMPRTGTTSLRRALERLGFGPCHHMEELFMHAEQVPRWLGVLGGGRDFERVLAGYSSAVDFPAMGWYREIMAAAPDAKVILSVREPTGWYDSMIATVHAINQDAPMRWIGHLLPRVGGIFHLARTRLFGEIFGGRFRDRAHAIGVFERHTAEVVAHVPAERLLVFDVRQGWGPLCAFLGVPVPDEPFPRLNDTAEFRRRVLATKVVCWTLLLAPILALAGLFAATQG